MPVLRRGFHTRRNTEPSGTVTPVTWEPLSVAGHSTPTKVDLVINLTTTKALGFTIPQTIPISGDRVIE